MSAPRCDASRVQGLSGAQTKLVAPAYLQPADLFLDRMGESIRGRTYVFTDLDGEELCLRPDVTLPACRVYLARHPKADVEARLWYNGPCYDGLVARFKGQPIPATGFSIGVSRLASALSTLGKLKDTALPGPVVVAVFDKKQIANPIAPIYRNEASYDSSCDR